MESKKDTALMAIDLSAAFDMVNHNILLYVLYHKFGIRGTALNWFESYLRPEYCKVSCRILLYTQKTGFQCSQGSCVGAKIFNTYSSTLTLVIPRPIDTHSFADDHALKDKFKIGNHSEERKYITNLENCALEVKELMGKTGSV